MKKMKCFGIVAILSITTSICFAQTNNIGLSVIRETDLKKDLYEFADDHFKGREASTLDELKAAAWLAEKARAAGLKPAGDDGTYFQYFDLYRNRVANNTSVKIGARSFSLLKDMLISQIAPATVSAPIVFLDNINDLDNVDIKGKAVAFKVSKDDNYLSIPLEHRKYLGYVSRNYAPAFIEKGAAAIIFIADDISENCWAENIPYLTRGSYDIEGGPYSKTENKPPYIWLHQSELEFIKKSGQTLTASINVESYLYPSINVVAKVDGTNPTLSKEYVLFSAHTDHDGIRAPEGTDSIYNGADDNGSACVALLAIGRAFKKQPGKRSALFVWHGAEERGLLGSKWYATHPTVPKKSIIAVLNADMIGRNNPDSAALLGSTIPHLNSKDLVNMALAANREGPNFKLDKEWDKPDHPEGFYYRSDHYPYAIEGMAAIFYTTLLHGEYHTPFDVPEHIDYKKLTKMTEWMYRTGWKVANATTRPRLD